MAALCACTPEGCEDRKGEEQHEEVIAVDLEGPPPQLHGMFAGACTNSRM